MAQVCTYLNFEGKTEEAFTFYKTVFGTQFAGDIMRHRDVPVPEGQSGPSADLSDQIMHIALPILGDHLLMGTDISKEMGMSLNQGNNVYIMLCPDTKEEADSLFAALSAGGTVEMEMADQFWGDYFGSLVDKFGVQWMIDIASEPQ